MRLKNLTDEQRQYYHTQRARLQTIKAAREMLFAEYPEAHKYAYNSFVLYEKTTEGSEDFKKALSAYREEAQTASFAAGESRIAALVEVGEEVLVRFRRALAIGEDKEAIALSREFREIMSEIRAETAPMNVGSEDMSFFEKMITGLSKMKPMEQEILYGSTEPN